MLVKYLSNKTSDEDGGDIAEGWYDELGSVAHSVTILMAEALCNELNVAAGRVRNYVTDPRGQYRASRRVPYGVYKAQLRARAIPRSRNQSPNQSAPGSGLRLYGVRS